MIEELKDVFDLATGATKLITELINLKANNKKCDENNLILANKNNDASIGSSGNWARIGSSGNWASIGSSGNGARIGSSGNGASIGSSGYGASIGSSGNWASIGSSGYGASIGSSGNDASIGSSGNGASIGSSGNGARIGSSGNGARIGSSGYGASIGSSGNWASIGSSGYGASIGSSGNWASIGSSGNRARIEVTGQCSIATAIGHKSIIKATKGSWITLAEYDNEGKPICVKSAQIDGEILKDSCFYTLLNQEFTEVQIIDGMATIIQRRKQNVIKGLSLSSLEPCFIYEKDGIYAHGETLKQAYRDWLFKTSDRDVSKYEDISPDDVYDLDFWVIAYRTITGACSFGTNEFLETHKDKIKKQMTLREVLEATENQYGHNTFKEFFNA